MILNYKKAAEEILSVIKEGKKICVISGAGISTATGIPDFRGETGIYNNSEKNVFDLKRFIENPEEFYSFGSKFLPLLYYAKPTSCHKLLAKLEDMGKINIIITQNIDNLHQKAGSKKIIEMHGNYNNFRCINCKESVSIEKILDKIKNGEVPYCLSCGKPLKPDVVFFGEHIAVSKINAAINYSSEADICFVIGSTLTVHPVAKIPEYALDNNAKLIIVNKGKTYLDEYAYKKYDLDTEILSVEILNLLNQKKFLIF